VLEGAGRVRINLEDDQVWVGGDTYTIVRGSAALGFIRLAWLFLVVEFGVASQPEAVGSGAVGYVSDG